MTRFLRLLGHEPKAVALELAISGTKPETVFEANTRAFRDLPRSPFAYWLSEDLRSAYWVLGRFAATGGVARVGLQTGHNFRHIRLWWEHHIEDGPDQRWFSFANGGRLSPWYADVPQVVGYDRAHQEALKTTGRYGRGATFYGQPGLTWAVRSARFAPSVLPSGGMFSHRGYCIFLPRDLIFPWCAVLNSSTFDFFFKVSLGRYSFPEFLVGVVPTIPVPDLDAISSGLLGDLALRGWSLRRSLDTDSEVSHAFVVPAVLQVGGGSFGVRVVGWAERVAGVEAELESVQTEIDEVCFELYGISDEDRRAITEGFGISNDSDDAADDDSDEDSDGSDVELDPVGLAAGLVSWCVGVATGRFDVGLATGEREWPSEPDPFDPLPVCSPGMLTDEDGLPLTEPPVGYPLGPSRVLVVDPGHRLDVTARVRAVFDVVFGDQADAWWTEVGEVLDPRGGEVSAWLSKGFFEHHLKTHSKSRRKAPIVWPIGTRSGSYQVWLYAHRATGDSLFRVLNDLIVPKLNAEESKLVRLRQEAGPNPSASERKIIDIQENSVSELVELWETVEELAPLWAPDLNDGVVIVLAPLWQLFGFHKPWMRELKKHWGKLVKGDYDWAQLAMHLWPERVIPKCVDDRSLAIAHGLEDVFWEPDPDHDDKWIPRDTPTTPIDQLITDRYNPTTQAALNTMDTT